MVLPGPCSTTNACWLMGRGREEGGLFPGEGAEHPCCWPGLSVQTNSVLTPRAACPCVLSACARAPPFANLVKTDVHMGSMAVDAPLACALWYLSTQC